MRNYFIFLPDSGGRIDSRELSIHIERMPDIQRAPERVKKIVVPGRSGTLTKTEGEDVYDSYPKAFDIVALDERKIQSIQRLLRGNGKIIFSNELQYRYTISITDGLSFNRFFRTWRRATLSMETQPFKESVEEKIHRGTFTEHVGGEDLSFGKGFEIALFCETDVPCPFFAELDVEYNNAMGGYWMYTNLLKENGIMFWSDEYETNKIYVNNEKGTIFTESGTNLLRFTKGYNFPQYLKRGENKIYFRTTQATKVTVKYRGWFL